MQIKKAKGEVEAKVDDYVIACSSLKGISSNLKVIEDLESRPHKAVTFLVELGKERQEWNEQKMPKALPGYSGGRLPERSTEEKGREEGEEVDESGERVRNEIIIDVIEGIQTMTVEKSFENERKITGGPDVVQSWDCSQIDNEGEEESWQECDQMAEQWEEEQHLEEIVERRRMEEHYLKLDAMQKST